MRDDEFVRMCKVFCLADHGCQHCVEDLFNEAIKVFPERKVDLEGWIMNLDNVL